MAEDTGGSMAKSSVQLERERLVNKWVPELFSSGFKSVLYIGANKRRQHFVDAFEYNNFSNITILYTNTYKHVLSRTVIRFDGFSIAKKSSSV